MKPPDRTRSDLRGVEAREAAGREKGNSSVVTVEDDAGAAEAQPAQLARGMTAEDHAASLARMDVAEDARFVAQVSGMHWTLQTRARSALLKSDDADQALRIIIEGWKSPDPDQRRHVDRVSQAWAREDRKNADRSKTDAETLLDALRSLDDDASWWFRCQLPGGKGELTGTEHRAREVVAELWGEVCHG